MSETKTTIEPFYGVVYLKDWWREGPGSHDMFMAVAGKISILNDEQHLGFKVQGNESNWGLRVSGETEEMFILGCQLRGCRKLAKPMKDIENVLVLP